MVLASAGHWLDKTMGTAGSPGREPLRARRPGVYTHLLLLTCVAMWQASACLPCLHSEGAGMRFSPRFPLAPSKRGAPHWGPLRAQVQSAGS